MRRRIETEQWQPGTKIPTLVELEREFQVARVTVRQAVDILRGEGLLRAQQGRGTFASEQSADRHWFKLATTWDVLIEQIRHNVLKPIKVSDPPRFPTLREGEGEPADKYVFLRSVQYKDYDAVRDRQFASRQRDLQARTEPVSRTPGAVGDRGLERF